MIIFTENDIKNIKKVVKKERKRWSNDKIFDNNFNKGEINYDVYKEIQIDCTWSDAFSQQYYNSQQYYRKHELNKIIEKIYLTTEWQKYYSNNKKIPKQELSQIFSYIKSEIIDDSYTNIEIFIAIGDFLDVNYKILYEMVAPEFKIALLRELNKEFNKIKEDNIVKLF